MRLMDRNPQHVFYIRGDDEDASHWKNFNLKDELIIRASSVSDEDVPLGKELDRFFNTLPLALYLIDKEEDKSIDVVRISYFDRKFSELNEESFSGFFKDSHDTELSIMKLGAKNSESDKKINIRAIIEGENRTSTYRPSTGLAQLEADKGATAWTQMSSPIESYRHLQDFYSDAFVILDIGRKLSDWTLTLYNQDVRELLGIKRAGIYNLVTGLRDYQKEKAKQKIDMFSGLYKELMNIDNEIESLENRCSITEKNK